MQPHTSSSLRRSLRTTALLLALAVTACPAPKGPVRSTPATQQLTILAINDFHGHLQARPLRTLETPPRTVLVGGAEALAATIAELRAKNPKRTLLLDAGDFMQGTLPSNHAEGAPVRALFAALGVDATAIGNHEFDFGPIGPAVEVPGGKDKEPNAAAGRRGALLAWTKQAPFPVLTANILRKSDGKRVDWPNVRPSILIERGGVKVGVVGLTTTDTPTTTLPSNVADLRFAKLAPVLIREAKALRARGAQVIVALAHVGGSCKGRDPRSCRGEIFDTVRALPPKLVDAVVAGHSHRCIWHRVNGVLVTEACSKGIAVGRIELTLRGGQVDGSASRVLPPTLVCQTVFADGSCEARLKQGKPVGPLGENPLLERHRALVSKVRTSLRPFRQASAKKAKQLLGRLARPLVHRYRGSSEVGYLFAEMLRKVFGGDIALMNAGGIRGNLGAGNITYAQIFSVFPFDNRVAIVQATGDQLRRMLAASLSREHAGVLQISGANARVRCGKPAKLLSLHDPKGKPLKPKQIYKVILSDFMLAGGDGLGPVLAEIPAARKRVLAGRLIREEMAAYLLKLGGSPLNTAQDPVLGPKSPATRVVGDCGGAGWQRRPRALCR
jgi:5'-nucleotidase